MRQKCLRGLDNLFSQICHKPLLISSAALRGIPLMSKTDLFCNRAEAFEAHDDVPLSPSDLDSIGDIIQRRYSRRDVVRGSLGVVAAASLFGPAAIASSIAPAPEDRFCFEEVRAGVDKTHHVAEGYQADVLLRWGDPLFSIRLPSIRTNRVLRRNSSNLATTMTTLPSFRSMRAVTAGFSASITNIPMKRSCSPVWPART